MKFQSQTDFFLKYRRETRNACPSLPNPPPPSPWGRLSSTPQSPRRAELDSPLPPPAGTWRQQAGTPPSPVGSDFLPLWGVPVARLQAPTPPTAAPGLQLQRGRSRPSFPEESDERCLLPWPQQPHPFRRMPARERARPRGFNSKDL